MFEVFTFCLKFLAVLAIIIYLAKPRKKLGSNFFDGQGERWARQRAGTMTEDDKRWMEAYKRGD